MDEPTSAIDPILEKNMIEQLTKNNAHRMAFMITHRLGSVQKMDKVIVLKDGTVKACGSHGNLIKEDFPCPENTQKKETPPDFDKILVGNGVK